MAFRLDPVIKDGYEPGHPGAAFSRVSGWWSADEHDVEAAFQFGRAVVGGQDALGRGAGEVADREPVQAEPEQIVGLVRMLSAAEVSEHGSRLV